MEGEMETGAISEGKGLHRRYQWTCEPFRPTQNQPQELRKLQSHYEALHSPYSANNPILVGNEAMDPFDGA